MPFLVFRNPEARYREEAFGGVVLYNSHLHLLSHDQLGLLDGLSAHRHYDDFTAVERDIVDEFLRKDIVLKIDAERALGLMNRRQPRDAAE